MILFKFLSSLYLLTAQPVIEPIPVANIEIVRNHGLETAEGRIAFLTDELTPFVNQAANLNEEIQDLSQRIALIRGNESPQAKEQIIALGLELNEKMNFMLAMLPCLETALHIDEDFQQIDAILNKEEPLEPAETEILERISTLCSCIDAHRL